VGGKKKGWVNQGLEEKGSWTQPKKDFRLNHSLKDQKRWKKHESEGTRLGPALILNGAKKQTKGRRKRDGRVKLIRAGRKT